MLSCVTIISERKVVAMDKKQTTEAQKRAKMKYMEKYVEAKVRMTPQKRDIIKAHADKHDNGSATAFINRAIDETMERDKGGE